MSAGQHGIVAVGSMALDTVETPFGKVREMLGGSATYFSVGARLFAPVAVVAVVGEDFPSRHLRLLSRLGVDVRGVTVEKGRTFRWKGRYGYDLNTARTLRTELNVFKTFRPEVPEILRRRRTVFLANIDPEIQLAALSQMRSPGLVACDSMNFWIETKKKPLLEVLRRVRIFLCNDAEARQLSGEHNLIGAARWILDRGPRLAVIKKGEHGVLCFSRDFALLAPAFPLEKVFDPTGAGDTFAGGFIGYLSRHGALSREAVRRAVVYGSVLASYNVESFGPARVARLKVADVERRCRLFREMTRF